MAIKKIVNSGNVFTMPSRTFFLSSLMLSKNIKIKRCKIIILPMVQHGCETLSLALREEHRLKIFENSVLRRIIGGKRNEVEAGWRRVYNEEELRQLYSSPVKIEIIKSIRMKLREGCSSKWGEEEHI
jgi:hypothetical protein